MKKKSIPVFWVTLALVGALILGTWPTDFTYFSDTELLWTYFRWRVATLAGVIVFLIGMSFVEFVRRHIYWLLYGAVVADVALTGFLFGRVETITLATPWFYVCYIIPFGTIVINVRIGRRILATLALPAVYILFFVGFRSGSDYWSYAYNDVIFNLVGSSSLISIMLGHIIYHLNRSNFLQSRQLRIHRRRIRDLADHDGLTGLFNRREFENRIENEFVRSRRYSRHLSIVMIDLDHFKKINDTYGHPAGDHILEVMGQIIRDETRNSDIRSRYGGEEFCLALTETALEDARKIGERLRKRLADEPFESDAGETFSVTCSLGITEQQKEDETFEDTLKRADQALYDAKSQGRDCIVCQE